MYLLRAPLSKFGNLPQHTPLITPEVEFTNNIAYCPKHFWRKFHVLQGCEDITPAWMKDARRDRKINRILIIATGGLGDSMWCMPVARYLREKYPKARILVATSEKNMPLWYQVPYADLCVKDEFWNLQAIIRNSDEVYDFGGIATFLKKEMTMDPIEATFYHVDISTPIEKEKMRPMLVVTLDEGKQMEAKLRREGVDLLKDKIVVISLEASTPNRNWPYTYTKALTRRLITLGYKVVWISSEKDFGRTYFFDCKCGWEFTFSMQDVPLELSYKCPACKKTITIDEVKSPDGVINWAGKTNIREVMALIAQADVFVGPNSGMMVIATSLNIPTVGLFGAFDPKMRAKFYEKFTGLFGKVDCSPCNEHWTECRRGYPAPCMKSIFPSKVYEALTNLLKKYPREPLGKMPID